MIRHSAIAVLLVLLFFAHANAREPVFLKMNHQFPENTLGSQIDYWFAQEVKKQTQGEVSIRIFWDNGLGGPEENLSLISRGCWRWLPCLRDISRINCP